MVILFWMRRKTFSSEIRLKSSNMDWGYPEGNLFLIYILKAEALRHIWSKLKAEHLIWPFRYLIVIWQRKVTELAFNEFSSCLKKILFYDEIPNIQDKNIVNWSFVILQIMDSFCVCSCTFFRINHHRISYHLLC